MSFDAWSQQRHGVRFEWGPAGARHGGTLVVVDVLSFTTAVSVAVEGGTEILPAATREAGAALARRTGAELAVGRHDVTVEHPWSLSPASLRSAPAPARLVLPSPNGSAIAAAADGAVVAACLRNARAVAAWLSEREGPVTVIAAGERWPDGSLRLALEDLLGAGAVVAALARHDQESPEATAARAVYESTTSVARDVRECASGVELITSGFTEDVEIAAEVDTTDVVPVLVDGAFGRS